MYLVILGDPKPGAVCRVDKMFVVKVCCNLTVNFHHEHLSTRLTAPGSPRMVPSEPNMDVCKSFKVFMLKINFTTISFISNTTV